jgi:hypothetical protein
MYLTGKYTAVGKQQQKSYDQFMKELAQEQPETRHLRTNIDELCRQNGTFEPGLVKHFTTAALLKFLRDTNELNNDVRNQAKTDGTFDADGYPVFINEPLSARSTYAETQKQAEKIIAQRGVR